MFVSYLFSGSLTKIQTRSDFIIILKKGMSMSEEYPLVLNRTNLSDEILCGVFSYVLYDSE